MNFCLSISLRQLSRNQLFWRSPSPYTQLQYCQTAATLRAGSAFLRPVVLVQRREFVYWPPPPDKRSKILQLPSGKKCFVFNAKRHQDGLPQTVLCFLDTHYNRLMWLDAEELKQFQSLVPRIRSYFELWEAKADQERLRQAQLTRLHKRQEEWLSSDTADI